MVDLARVPRLHDEATPGPLPPCHEVVVDVLASGEVSVSLVVHRREGHRFVASVNLPIIQRRAIFGVPDLLVELVSPSSVRRDRYDKRDLYARFGVKEYWIGDPANKAMEILTLKEGRYELSCCAEEKGKLNSLVLVGLEFDLSEIQ